MKLVILSERKNLKKAHVSYDTVLGLESEFENTMLESSEHTKSKAVLFFSRWTWTLNRLGRKLKIGDGIFKDRRLINAAKKMDKNTMAFFAAMNFEDVKKHASTLSAMNERLIIYVFDCWESKWELYDSVFSIINPFAICFAYEKSQKYFSKKGYKNCWFVPQSMDVRYFHDYSMKKTRLFMQMGRRVEELHNLVCNYLQENHIENIQENYVFERTKGKVVFEDTELLAREINCTRFFLAAPQCIHNRELTGDISEVTARFYEAMACKSLIIGVKPKDTFDLLFPYKDAMIEVDKANFQTEIARLLEDEERYTNLINKNYDHVMAHHRWRNRYYQIIDMLEKAMQKQSECM